VLRHLQERGGHDAAVDGYGLRGEQSPDGGKGGGSPTLFDAASTGRKSNLLRQLHTNTRAAQVTHHMQRITCNASTLTHEMHLFD
jgi:hypothetical protein